jgi:hypothetical protein
LPFSGFLDQGQRCTGCGAVAFDPALGELEQKCLGRRDATFGSAFADGCQLAEDGLVGCLPMTPAGTTGPISATITLAWVVLGDKVLPLADLFLATSKIAAVLNERKMATPTGGVWHAATVIRVQKRLGMA